MPWHVRATSGHFISQAEECRGPEHARLNLLFPVIRILVRRHGVGPIECAKYMGPQTGSAARIRDADGYKFEKQRVTPYVKLHSFPMRVRHVFVITLLLACSMRMSAANLVATGQVLDERKKAVLHAVVTIVGKTTTVSDRVSRNGRFSIPIATTDEDAWCDVSAAGYRPLRLRLDRRENEFVGGTITMKSIVRLETLSPSSVNANDLLLPVAISSDTSFVAEGFRLRGSLPPGHCSGPMTTLLFTLDETIQILRKAGEVVTGTVDIKPPTSMVQSFKGEVEFNPCSGGMLVLTGKFPVQIGKDISTLNIVLPGELRIHGAPPPSTIAVLSPARPRSNGIMLELLVVGGGAIEAAKLFDASFSLRQVDQ